MALVPKNPTTKKDMHGRKPAGKAGKGSCGEGKGKRKGYGK